MLKINILSTLYSYQYLVYRVFVLVISTVKVLVLSHH